MGFSWQEYWSGLTFSSPGDLSWPRDRTCFSCVSCLGRQILHHYATWEDFPWQSNEAIFFFSLSQILPLRFNTVSGYKGQIWLRHVSKAILHLKPEASVNMSQILWASDFPQRLLQRQLWISTSLMTTFSNLPTHTTSTNPSDDLGPHIHFKIERRNLINAKELYKINFVVIKSGIIIWRLVSF